MDIIKIFISTEILPMTVLLYIVCANLIVFLTVVYSAISIIIMNTNRRREND